MNQHAAMHKSVPGYKCSGGLKGSGGTKYVAAMSPKGKKSGGKKSGKKSGY